MLESACCFDQLNAPILATIELMVRQIQSVEEKWKDRCARSQDRGDVDPHLHLCMGLRAGVGSRGGLCICPAPSEHIAKQLQKDAAASKERRRAREEPQLAIPKTGANPGQPHLGQLLVGCGVLRRALGSFPARVGGAGLSRRGHDGLSTSHYLSFLRRPSRHEAAVVGSGGAPA